MSSSETQTISRGGGNSESEVVSYCKPMKLMKDQEQQQEQQRIIPPLKKRSYRKVSDASSCDEFQHSTKRMRSSSFSSSSSSCCSSSSSLSSTPIVMTTALQESDTAVTTRSVTPPSTTTSTNNKNLTNKNAITNINNNSKAEITVYGDHDVLSGRGGGTTAHSGNCYFRSLVDKNRRAYLTARKTEKSRISKSIVRAIHDRKGRFLKRNEKTNLWVEISPSAAREKTSQALRQSAPEYRKVLLGLSDIPPKPLFYHHPTTPPPSSSTLNDGTPSILASDCYTGAMTPILPNTDGAYTTRISPSPPPNDVNKEIMSSSSSNGTTTTTATTTTLIPQITPLLNQLSGPQKEDIIRFMQSFAMTTTNTITPA